MFEVSEGFLFSVTGVEYIDYGRIKENCKLIGAFGGIDSLF